MLVWQCVHEPLAESSRALRAPHAVVTERRAREIHDALADTHVSHIALDAVRHSQEEPL